MVMLTNHQAHLYARQQGKIIMGSGVFDLFKTALPVITKIGKYALPALAPFLLGKLFGGKKEEPKKEEAKKEEPIREKDYRDQMLDYGDHIRDRYIEPVRHRLREREPIREREEEIYEPATKHKPAVKEEIKEKVEGKGLKKTRKRKIPPSLMRLVHGSGLSKY